MARYNSVVLYGRVMNPNIKYEMNTPVKAYMTVCCLRRRKALQNTDGLETLDTPLVFTSDPVLMNKIAALSEDSMVLVKGVLKTKRVTKKYFCPNCKKVTAVENCQFVYVRPIALKKMECDIAADAAYNLMKDFDEMSNSCQCIGRLCRDVDYYAGSNMDVKALSMSRYQIAINRQFRDSDDEESARTDYPWVITRGKQADSDSQALHTNSLVFLNASLETREFGRNITCTHCSSEFVMQDKTLQLVPYRVEYLEDCDLPESKLYKSKKDSDDNTEEDT